MTQLFHAVAFDFDGTLLDSLPLHRVATQAAIQEVFHEEVDASTLAKSLGAPLQHSMEMISGGRGKVQELCDAYLTYYNTHVADEVTLFPNTLQTIQALQAKKIKLAILSNRLRDWGMNDMRMFHTTELFDVIIFAEDMPEPKPSGLAMLPIMNAFRMNPAEILVVGDSPKDILCARNAGSPSAAALWGASHPERTLAENPELRPKDIAELLRYF